MFFKLLTCATTTTALVILSPLQAIAADSGMPSTPPQSSTPNFQPYIFWAYALVCVLLFLFTLWSVLQTRQIGNQVEWLKRRMEEMETTPRQSTDDSSPSPEK